MPHTCALCELATDNERMYKTDKNRTEQNKAIEAKKKKKNEEEKGKKGSKSLVAGLELDRKLFVRATQRFLRPIERSLL